MVKLIKQPYLTIFLLSMSYLAGVFLPRPSGRDYLSSSPLAFSIELLSLSALMAFGLSVLNIFRQNKFDETICLPGLFGNSMQPGQALLAYDSGFKNIIFYALGCMSSEVFMSPPTYFWQIPFLLGFGGWLGMRFAIYALKDKIKNKG